MKNTKLVNLNSNVARKLVAFLSAILVACLFVAHPVFAAETEKPVEEETTEAQSVGSLIAVNQGRITGGFGSVVVYMDSANWWPDFYAACSGGDGSVVTCSVVTPDGDSYLLGTFTTDGSVKSKYVQGSGRLPAGNYTFYFNAASTQPFYALCKIFD